MCFWAVSGGPGGGFRARYFLVCARMGGPVRKWTFVLLSGQGRLALSGRAPLDPPGLRLFHPEVV